METNNSLKPFISILIVNFNAGPSLVECIESAQSSDLPPEDYEILVWDNASIDGSLEPVTEKGGALIFNSGTNIGFAAACNRLAEKSRGKYMLFVNPDARIERDLAGGLRDFLEDRPDAGAVGPRMEYPDGRLQPSRGTFPSVKTTYAHLFNLKRFMPSDEMVVSGVLGKMLGRWFAQYKPIENVPIKESENPTDSTTAPQRVDYATGACLMVRGESFREIGGFDELFFLFYEEIDLCRRLMDKGFGCYFLDDVCAVHEVGGCSGDFFQLVFTSRYCSMIRYFEKHGSFLSEWAVRTGLAFIMSWRLFRWALAGANKRGQPDLEVFESAYKSLAFAFQKNPRQTRTQ